MVEELKGKEEIVTEISDEFDFAILQVILENPDKINPLVAVSALGISAGRLVAQTRKFDELHHPVDVVFKHAFEVAYKNYMEKTSDDEKPTPTDSNIYN